MERLLAPLSGLAAQEGRLFLWAPVLLGTGIGVYFLALAEPGALLLGTLSITFLAATALGRLGGIPLRLPANVLALLVLGFILASFRAHLVSGPVLPFRYYGPIEGRVVDIDRSFSDALRLTLDSVVLADVRPDETPRRVRVALHGDAALVPVRPGATVILTGHLAAPDGPVSPGGFDFQRLAWFGQLGAVGYTRTPVLELEPSDEGAALAAFRARMALSEAMQSRMEGQAGALAAAFMTGDRSGIDAATNEAMRASNLSHMISISGLHMGLLTGFVFGLVRYGLALVPAIALRVPTKKIAAVVALVAAAGYLALAGPDVATKRAFVMAAVMLVAVLADRRAISLHSLAAAALLILFLEPESLVEPGFQMSFAATAALILVLGPVVQRQGRVPFLLRHPLMLVVSSLAAGLATGPIAAAHFNRVAAYGLVANFLAVPVMGIAVMPAGVIAAILAPLGLADPALFVMEFGCRIILAIAYWVAGFGGAVWAVHTPHPAVLPLFALGLVAAGLLRGPLRLAGLPLVAAAGVLWAASGRPALLVSADGKLVGVMTEAGRALSKPKGAGFVAQTWLEDDGDIVAQEDAFARSGFTGQKGEVRAMWSGRTIWHLTGKTAPDRIAGVCTGDALVVTDAEWTEDAPGSCTILDAARLKRLGSVAFDASLRITSAREASGDRLWNRRPERSAGSAASGAGHAPAPDLSQ